MNTLNHIAFIMDGNGRWGLKKKKNRNYGHLKGLETIKKIVNGSINLKIPIVTFYVFSTENWKRPKVEINFLFKLIDNYFSKEINNVLKQGIRLKIFGEINKLPTIIQKTLRKSEKLTKKNKKIVVNLAINYGSKLEILHALKKCKRKMTLRKIEKNLYLRDCPDLLIRTGGHKRLSNFMLWQLAYTELFFIDKLWPDFRVQDLVKIIKKFKNIKRNFGAI